MRAPVVARFVVEVYDVGGEWDVRARFDTPNGSVCEDAVAVMAATGVEALEELLFAAMMDLP